MSINALVQGSRKLTTTILTTTNETTVFSANAGERSVVVGMAIANVDTSNAVTAKIVYNDGTTDYTYVQEVSIASKATQEYDFPFVFTTGNETLKVTAGSANDLHVFVTTISGLGANG